MSYYQSNYPSNYGGGSYGSYGGHGGGPPPPPGQYGGAAYPGGGGYGNYGGYSSGYNVNSAYQMGSAPPPGGQYGYGQELLKKKPSSLLAFNEDTEWAEGLVRKPQDNGQGLGGQSRDGIGTCQTEDGDCGGLVREPQDNDICLGGQTGDGIGTDQTENGDSEGLVRESQDNDTGLGGQSGDGIGTGQTEDGDCGALVREPQDNDIGLGGQSGDGIGTGQTENGDGEGLVREPQDNDIGLGGQSGDGIGTDQTENGDSEGLVRESQDNDTGLGGQSGDGIGTGQTEDGDCGALVREPQDNDIGLGGQSGDGIGTGQTENGDGEGLVREPQDNDIGLEGQSGDGIGTGQTEDGDCGALVREPQDNAIGLGGQSGDGIGTGQTENGDGEGLVREPQDNDIGLGGQSGDGLVTGQTENGDGEGLVREPQDNDIGLGGQRGDGIGTGQTENGDSEGLVREFQDNDIGLGGQSGDGKGTGQTEDGDCGGLVREPQDNDIGLGGQSGDGIGTSQTEDGDSGGLVMEPQDNDIGVGGQSGDGICTSQTEDGGSGGLIREPQDNDIGLGGQSGDGIGTGQTENGDSEGLVREPQDNDIGLGGQSGDGICTSQTEDGDSGGLIREPQDNDIGLGGQSGDGIGSSQTENGDSEGLVREPQDNDIGLGGQSGDGIGTGQTEDGDCGGLVREPQDNDTGLGGQSGDDIGTGHTEDGDGGGLVREPQDNDTGLGGQSRDGIGTGQMEDGDYGGLVREPQDNDTGLGGHSGDGIGTCQTEDGDSEGLVREPQESDIGLGGQSKDGDGTGKVEDGVDIDQGEVSDCVFGSVDEDSSVEGIDKFSLLKCEQYLVQIDAECQGIYEVSDGERENEGSVVHGQDEGSVVHGQDEDSVVHGQDEGSVVHGQDEGSVVHGQDEDSVVHGQDEGSVVHGQDEGSVVQGQDEGSVVQGQDEDSVVHGQDEGSVVHGQDEDSVVHGQDEGSVVHGQDEGSVVQGQDEDSVVHGQDEGSVVHGQDEGSVVHGQDEGSVVQGQDEDSVVHGQDEGSVVHGQDEGSVVQGQDEGSSNPDKNLGDGTDIAVSDEDVIDKPRKLSSKCIKVQPKHRKTMKRKYDSNLSESSDSSDHDKKYKGCEKKKKRAKRLYNNNLSDSSDALENKIKCKNSKKKKKRVIRIYDSNSSENSFSSEDETQCKSSEKWENRAKRQYKSSSRDKTKHKRGKKKKKRAKRQFDNSSEDEAECKSREKKKKQAKRKYDLSKISDSLEDGSDTNKGTEKSTKKKRKYDATTSVASDSCENVQEMKKKKTIVKRKSNSIYSETSYIEETKSDSDCENISFKRCETKIKKKCKKRDINNGKIFVRRLLESKFKSGGTRKKTDRVWNQVHACIFCKKIVTNYSKHLRKHKKEPKVEEILSTSSKMGPRHKVVRAMWDCIRNEGDHLHNRKVLERGKGEFILGRRHHGRFDITKYGPCMGCYVWIKLDKTMYRHQDLCPAVIVGKTKSTKFGLKELRIQALHLSGKISPMASKLLLKEVYTIMTNDDVTEVAHGDPLIISLGNLWLMKNAGNKLKRKYYTSSRMRGAARLLINLRKLTEEEKGFQEFLKPEYFDKIVTATLFTASPDMDDEEDLKSPSTALKLGYDVKRLAGAKWGIALRNKESDVAGECKNFLKLMKFEWSVKVAKTALITLQIRRFNKVKQLPEPNDLYTLQDHVKKELETLDLSDNSFRMYRKAEVLVQTRLLMYNKRRSGEIEVISVKDYLKRVTGVSEVDKAMREEMSPLEMKLLESQDLMEVRGKFGRGVPVIIPQDVREVLKYLVNAEARENSGVLSSNNYLFPNTSIGVVRAYESLKKMCGEVKLKKPEKITSVNLRKYTATISQIFDLTSQQQQWLANHLGHSLDIHKIHYRQTSGVIERVDMAKLMLMQELNVTAKYAGRKLEDIQLPEVVFATDDATDNPLEVELSNDEVVPAVLMDQVNGDIEEDFQPDLLKDDTYDEYNFEEDEDDDDYDQGNQRKQRNKGYQSGAVPGFTSPAVQNCANSYYGQQQVAPPQMPASYSSQGYSQQMAQYNMQMNQMMRQQAEANMRAEMAAAKRSKRKSKKGRKKRRDDDDDEDEDEEEEEEEEEDGGKAEISEEDVKKRLKQIYVGEQVRRINVSGTLELTSGTIRRFDVYTTDDPVYLFIKASDTEPQKIFDEAEKEEKPKLPRWDPDWDCRYLKDAMDGLGTNEKNIIYLASTRNNEQRQALKLQYKTSFGKDLIEELSSELSFNFKNAVMSLFVPPAEYDSWCIKEAIYGPGTDERALIEILLTRTNPQIKEIRNTYSTVASPNRAKTDSLIEKDIEGDCSGDFKRLLYSASQGNRKHISQKEIENAVEEIEIDGNKTGMFEVNFEKLCDMDRAKADAKNLFKAGEDRWGTDEATFIRIFANRDYYQLRATYNEYVKLTQRDIENSINRETSGDFERGLLAIARSIKNRPKFFAMELKSAMKGLGTKDNRLIRIIVSRSEIDMVQIKKEFLEETKQTLWNWLDQDCSGDYKKMLQAIVGRD